MPLPSQSKCSEASAWIISALSSPEPTPKAATPDTQVPLLSCQSADVEGRYCTSAQSSESVRRSKLATAVEMPRR